MRASKNIFGDVFVGDDKNVLGYCNTIWAYVYLFWKQQNGDDEAVTTGIRVLPHSNWPSAIFNVPTGGAQAFLMGG